MIVIISTESANWCWYSGYSGVGSVVPNIVTRKARLASAKLRFHRRAGAGDIDEVADVMRRAAVWKGRTKRARSPVIPAEAGIHFRVRFNGARTRWIPASAGMTSKAGAASTMGQPSLQRLTMRCMDAL